MRLLDNIRRIQRTGALAFSVVGVVLLATDARAEDAPPLAISHALVYGPGTKLPLVDTTVVLAAGKIVSVGSSATMPPGAVVLDAHGKTVTAGFIDADTDVGAVEIDMESRSNDTDARGLLLPGLRMVDAYNPRSALVPIARAGGVTSVIVAPRAGAIAGQSAFVDLAGDTQADAVVRASVAQYARADEDEAQAVGTRSALWMTLRQALDDARFYSTHKAQYDANGTRTLGLRRMDLEALLPVLRGEQPLVVTTHRASDIETALRFAEEFKLKLVLRGASEAWLMAEEIAKAHVPVILDPLEDLPEGFDRLRSRSDNAALLSAAGVVVVLSTFSSHEARLLWQRAGNAVRLGMDHDAAIRAVTEAPADAFGLKGYGRLEAGAVANVVVWSGDPLQIGTRVEHVFVRGREQPLETRQTLLLNRYRTLPFAHDGTR
ncbi:MAG TPA: amidohydrolase family protein [Polyangiaceae bacterium]